jgi:hypothetical protein
MSAIYGTNEIERLKRELFHKFDCVELRQGKNYKEPRERRQRRELAQATLAAFIKAMNGPNAPKTKADAVAMVFPGGIWFTLIWVFVRPLVIKMVQWLWDRTQ